MNKKRGFMKKTLAMLIFLVSINTKSEEVVQKNEKDLKFNSIKAPKNFNESVHFLESNLYFIKTQSQSLKNTNATFQYSSAAYDPYIELKYSYKADRNNYFKASLMYGKKDLDSNDTSSISYPQKSPVQYRLGISHLYRFDRDLSIESTLGLKRQDLGRVKTSTIYLVDSFDLPYASEKLTYMFLKGSRSVLGVDAYFMLLAPVNTSKYSGESEDIRGSLNYGFGGMLFTDRYYSSFNLKIGAVFESIRINTNLYKQEEYGTGLFIKFLKPF